MEMVAIEDYLFTLSPTHSYPVDYVPLTLHADRAFPYDPGQLRIAPSTQQTFNHPTTSSTADIPQPDASGSNPITAMTSEQHEFLSDPCIIQKLLPYPYQESLRKLLRDMMEAKWWRQNQPEPEGVFTPFIETVAHHQYDCIFCDTSNSRMDRAVAHCRKHLRHRPFYCNGEKCRNGFGTW